MKNIKKWVDTFLILVPLFLNLKQIGSGSRCFAESGYRLLLDAIRIRTQIKNFNDKIVKNVPTV